MHGGDDEVLLLLVELGVEEAGEPITDEDRVREVPVHALRLRLELLEDELEAEQLFQPRPVEERPVIRIQDRHPSAGVLGEARECLRIDPPFPPRPLDDRRLTGRADRRPRRLLARDPGGLQAPTLEHEARVLGIQLGNACVNPLADVPHALTSLAADDPDLTEGGEQVEHARHLIGAVPAGLVVMGHLTRVGDLGREHRPLRPQPSEDVATEPVVRRHPGRRALTEHAGAHPRQMCRQEGCRVEVSVELEQQPVLLDGLPQLARLVRPADPAPQHGVLGGGDRRGGVDLDRTELLGDLDDIARPCGVQQLRAHRDPSRLLARQMVGGGVGGHTVNATRDRRHAHPAPAPIGSGSNADADPRVPSAVSRQPRARISPWGSRIQPSSAAAHSRHAALIRSSAARSAIPSLSATSEKADCRTRSAHMPPHHARSSGDS